MARGYFKCAECREMVSVNIGRNRRDTDRHCDWLESQGRLCSDCYQKEQEKTRQAAAKAAAETARETGLPALTGSEKQIAWAETIRIERLAQIEAAIASYDDKKAKLIEAGRMGQAEEQAKKDGFTSLDDAFSCGRAAAEELKKQVSSHWWIENRDINIGNLLVDKAKAIAKARKEAIPAAVDAKTEATIRPENPITETVAEIRALESSVDVLFPEKREDFWQIIKKQLGYEWSGSAWQRKLTITNGTPADRAAEAGNKLLAAGFVIRIFSPEIREAAINGTFEQECKRWIQVRSSGQYTDWLVPTWPGQNDALYNASRKIKGSKYDKPWVVIPPEHFEEVLDFANLYEFRITEKAQAVIDSARSVRDAALVAKPAKVEDHRPPVPGDKPEKLAVPESVEVADEFKD